MTYAVPLTHAPPAGDPTSIVGRRIGAWFIDLAIYFLIGLAITAAFGGAESESHEFRSQAEATSFCSEWRAQNEGICFPSGSQSTGTAVTFRSGGAGTYWVAIHFVLFCIIQGLLGGSLGKRILGLRVVTADGKPIGIGRSFARTVMWIVDAFTCMLPILGGIMILSTKGHRRVGDMVAGTYVVSEYNVGRPLAIPGVTSGYGTPGYQAQGYQGAGGYAPGGYAPGGYTQPAPGAWTPPAEPAPSTVGGALPGAPAPTAAPATGDGPTWDAARNAYIQYDRELSAWVQWSDASGAWLPIDQ